MMRPNNSNPRHIESIAWKKLARAYADLGNSQIHHAYAKIGHRLRPRCPRTSLIFHISLIIQTLTQQQTTPHWVNNLDNFGQGLRRPQWWFKAKSTWQHWREQERGTGLMVLMIDGSMVVGESEKNRHSFRTIRPITNHHCGDHQREQQQCIRSRPSFDKQTPTAASVIGSTGVVQWCR